MTSQDKTLHLAFHGRVIDHLGIEMYQSPVAAIAELISNAWDADAPGVTVTLPTEALTADSEIIVEDSGRGMTFEECQQRYLNVGYNQRRLNPMEKSPGGRPLMGRKGIGKFAGFGIASVVTVSTTSSETGERTTFRLNLNELRGDGSEYAGSSELPIEVLDYEGPNNARRSEAGTSVRLQQLSIKNRPNANQFRRSMARRFLLLQRAEGFSITVNNENLPETEDLERIEFDFPSAYEPGQRPTGLQLDGALGIETLPDGNKIRWRIMFYRETIDEEELAGVSVYAHGKLAQRPFLFNLGGGLGGQHGAAYLTGIVEADFIDEQDRDLIATERQRVNWENDLTASLLEWGQERIQALLREWKERRAAEKVRLMEERLLPFSTRLQRLPTHERRVVDRALRSVAKITTLSNAQFEELASAMLTAWEGGRLRELINSLGDVEDMAEADLIQVLMESKVLTALHTAEMVRTKVDLIGGLRRRIENQELENAVRDYIADSPWLVSPRWETFQTERSVGHLIDEALDEAGIREDDSEFDRRVDLALSADTTLLVIEFMRPGKKLDWDHVDRYRRYIRILRDKIRAANGRFSEVHGVLVADRLEERTGMPEEIEQLRREDMDVIDWPGLLARAESQWRDYLELLQERSPDDQRLKAIATPGELPSPETEGEQEPPQAQAAG